MRVLILTRYGTIGASSRLRFLQYTQFFNKNISYTNSSFFSNDSLSAKYKLGRYKIADIISSYLTRIKILLRRNDFDLIWIEKEALPWCPLWFESLFLSGVPYVLDYDDAVFHNYDLSTSFIVRFFLGLKLDGLMTRSTLVICGNDYLVRRAVCSGAPWVERLPTVIDLIRYPGTSPSIYSGCKNLNDNVPRIVWIGSPSTAKYLELIRGSLLKLATHTDFVLRVIGVEFNLEGVQVESIPWDEATEVALIADCTVGIMPLNHSPWELGKCGYKLIQYMACGLPVIGSDIGVNAEIVKDGINGFLVKNNEDWERLLALILDNPDIQHRMGLAGRHMVEDKFCIQKTESKLIEWLKQAASVR
jgi:glycosyltransferase involved in cell wall biosynthesis